MTDLIYFAKVIKDLGPLTKNRIVRAEKDVIYANQGIFELEREVPIDDTNEADWELDYITQTLVWMYQDEGERSYLKSITKKVKEAYKKTAVTSTDAASFIPVFIESAYFKDLSFPVQECVKQKIPVLMEEHKDWNHDKVVAIAISMCQENPKS